MVSINFSAQTVYQTIANGPWGSSSSWQNGIQPPVTLPYGDTIHISHDIDVSADITVQGFFFIDSNGSLDGFNSLIDIEVYDKGELINFGKIHVHKMTVESYSCSSVNVYLPRVSNYGKIYTEDDMIIGSNDACGSLFNFLGGKIVVGLGGSGELHLDYYLCNQDTIYIATKLYNHGGIVDCCGYIETPLVDVDDFWWNFNSRPGEFKCANICTSSSSDPILIVNNTTYSSLNDAYSNAPSSQVIIDNDSVYFCGFNQNGTPLCNSNFSYGSNVYCNDNLNPFPLFLSPSVGQPSGLFNANDPGLVFVDPSTGEIFLQQSDAGLYTIYFNYGSCVDSFDLEVVDPAFHYSNAIYCNHSSNPTPVITGTIGGVFSADTSISISSSTGEIDIGLSNDTSYLVLCEINSCIDTFQLEIIDASFIYSDTSFCISALNDTAVVLGNYTGAFSANSTDLSLNNLNGIIDFGLSSNQLYSIYHTTPQGCLDTFDLEIISAEFYYLDSLFCSYDVNDSAIILGNSNGTFAISPSLLININTGEIDFSNSFAQQYTVTYLVGGCSEIFNLEIVNSEINYFDSLYCSYAIDTAANIIGNTGGSFSSSPSGLVFANDSIGEIDFDSTIANSYSIIYNVAGCVDVFDLEVVNSEISYFNTVYCKGQLNDSANILGNSGGVFSSSSTGLVFANDSTGEINFDSTQIGQYSIVYAISGCYDTVNLELASASFDYGKVAYCSYNDDTVANIIGNPAGVFTSDPSDLSFLNTTTGEIDFLNSLDTIYWVYYNVMSTCIDSFQLEVINLQANAGLDDSICGLSYQLTGQNHFSASYSWYSPEGFAFSPSSIVIDPIVTVNSEGFNFFILELTEQQCSALDTVEIIFVDSLLLDAGPDQNIYQSTANLSAQTNNGTYFYWENLNNTGTILQPDSLITGLTGLVTGDYVFGITASNDICPSVYDQVTYIVNWVFIPSGFSPNGDGFNDLFLVEGARLTLDFEMQIVNRWGELIYATSNIFDGWDGTFNGSESPVDTYFYFIRISDNVYKGYLELKR